MTPLGGHCPHRDCGAGPFQQVRSHHNNAHQGDRDSACAVCQDNAAAQRAPVRKRGRPPVSVRQVQLARPPGEPGRVNVVPSPLGGGTQLVDLPPESCVDLSRCSWCGRTGTLTNLSTGNRCVFEDDCWEARDEALAQLRAIQGGAQ